MITECGVFVATSEKSEVAKCLGHIEALVAQRTVGRFAWEKWAGKRLKGFAFELGLHTHAQEVSGNAKTSDFSEVCEENAAFCGAANGGQIPPRGVEPLLPD